MKTNLEAFLEFPCRFPFKVIGLAQDNLQDQVMDVVQRHVPGDYLPEVRPSSKGNYHSISFIIDASHISQIETLYTELSTIEGVLKVL